MTVLFCKQIIDDSKPDARHFVRGIPLEGVPQSLQVVSQTDLASARLVFQKNYLLVKKGFRDNPHRHSTPAFEVVKNTYGRTGFVTRPQMAALIVETRSRHNEWFPVNKDDLIALEVEDFNDFIDVFFLNLSGSDKLSDPTVLFLRETLRPVYVSLLKGE